ncbi:SCO family protein [Thiomonas bhubaneswarensis]|uniref:Cytochrome oxidase Cu insertion factor, SCO1/SenC/PrrC family n=1 Tax=Thiomonas bhubaneswarensis TaxID=339866 RepID=A0A0K6I283_9BURK|nr:SCO family protein [Thiomonas bhubaneswarensis]CUA97186.1 Cytochrome oxidase Cu insertion factor, SCO1/SenC/PrrC family [Thiomonas bhubaneswarensis]
MSSTQVPSRARRLLLLAALALPLAGCGHKSDQTWQLNNITGVMPDLQFNLTNDLGQKVTAENYKGKIVLLYFGYTHCPDVCPTTMQLMANVVQQLGPEAKDVRILFVSVDPKRDSNTILKAYTQAFSPNAIGLTGTMKEIDAITRRYRVAFSYGKPDAQGNYVVDHSAGVYIFGPNGRIRLLASDTNPPTAWVHDLKQLIADEA